MSLNLTMIEVMDLHKKRRKMSDGDLAGILSISSHTIPNWRASGYIPTWHVISVCKVLDISPNVLFQWGEE